MRNEGIEFIYSVLRWWRPAAVGRHERVRVMAAPAATAGTGLCSAVVFAARPPAGPSAGPPELIHPRSAVPLVMELRNRGKAAAVAYSLLACLASQHNSF